MFKSSQEPTSGVTRHRLSSRHDASFLKPLWGRTSEASAWLVSLLVLVVLGAARFYAMLGPAQAEVLYLLYCAGAGVVPYLLLTSHGRRQIGLRRHSASVVSIALSVLAGAACALIFYAIGMALYGDSPDNWLMGVRAYLRLNDMRSYLPSVAIFALYALPAMFLTPIGEEILFRGFIQQAFTRRWGSVFATTVSSLAYAAMYLCLHALWRDADGIHFRVLPGVLTVLLLGAVGVVFTLCRLLSKSLWPAMAAHAAFNVTIVAVLTFHGMPGSTSLS